MAAFLPLTFLGGDARSRWLATTPLALILILTPRPSVPPGALIAAGFHAGNGTKDFCWLVWQRGHNGRAEIDYLHR